MLIAVIMESVGVVAVKYTGQGINGRRQDIVPGAIPTLEPVESIEQIAGFMKGISIVIPRAETDASEA